MINKLMKKVLSGMIILGMLFTNMSYAYAAGNKKSDLELQQNEVEENRELGEIIKEDEVEKSDAIDENVINEGVNSITGCKVLNINEGWEFTQDGKSESVNLPHCWEYIHPQLSYIPIMNSKTAVYTKRLNVSDYAGKNKFLKFYGVNKNAKIYIDDKYVGEHVGGFTAFVLDITKFINNDTIEIKVENTNIDIQSMPINSDFTHWAGLYRDVELIVTEDTYIAKEDSGSNGIYINKESLSKTQAVITAKVKVSSKSDNIVNNILNIKVSDKDGNVVDEVNQDININPNEVSQEVTSKLTINNPHLWQGTDDPYLYNVEVKLIDSNNEILDGETQKIGLRTFEVKDGIFYLNGKEYELHGVGMHQDRESYGNATSNEMKEEDINTVLDMGANAIRTAHYPHDHYVYDLADEKGIIIWNEIPFYMIMSKSDTFRNTTKQQLVEMIRQSYNHPSIICWGIQNEVNTNAEYSMYGSDFDVDTETLSNFMRELAALAKSEDSSRFVVQAHIDGANKLAESLNWSLNNSDIDYTGFNLYYGFKTGVKAADKSGVETIQNQFASKINSNTQTLNTDSIVISEYGAGGNINQHATINSDFSWSGNDNAEKSHPEEYQSFVHEAAYEQISKQDNVWAAFVWNMFDFSSYRNQAGNTRLNNKGLITYDHKTKKDAFYFYKANWNKKDKFTYITSRRMTERTQEDSTIKVYSNCDKVELLVNGINKGQGKKQQDGVFVWENVVYNDGNNAIKAVGTSDGKKYNDEISVNAKNSLITYSSHVQGIGWQDKVADGELSGTEGTGKRVEAIKINISDKLLYNYNGNIKYKAYVQGAGWQDWILNKEIAGTEGQAKPMEAVKIKLTGELEDNYDVYYQVYIQGEGWQDWVLNGEISGIVDQNKIIEAVRIKLVENNEKINYSAHVQKIGWQDYVSSGEMIGTEGESKRIEAISINLSEKFSDKYSGNIEYKTHVQSKGWQDWVSNGKVAGTEGQAKRMEAVKIRLTGELADNYDVYYQAHVQGEGWQDWVSNGEIAGREGKSKRLEAIRIKLVKKNNEISYQTHIQKIGWQDYVSNGEVSGIEGQSKRIEAIKINVSDNYLDKYNGNIEYQAHVQSVGWQNWAANGEIAGTEGQAKRIEAIKIKLTDELAAKYDIYYRVHVQKYGWLDWAKNGEIAGTMGYSYRLEALEIRLAPKDENIKLKQESSYKQK